MWLGWRFLAVFDTIHECRGTITAAAVGSFSVGWLLRVSRSGSCKVILSALSKVAYVCVRSHSFHLLDSKREHHGQPYEERTPIGRELMHTENGQETD